MRASKPDVSCTSAQIDEAAVWMAMLYSRSRDARTEQGFRRWLKANPAHPVAFERVSIAHEITGAIRLKPLPPDDLFRRNEVTAKRTSFVPTFAIAVATCLIIAIGGLLYSVNADRDYTTEVGEQRTFNLADGTRVLLNTDSRVIDRYSDRQRLVELTRGEALFDVARGQPQRPFLVKAGGRQITALGTTFVVKINSSKHRVVADGSHRPVEHAQLQVTLLEGKIAVNEAHVADGATDGESDKSPGSPQSGRSSGSNNVILDPGQRLTFADHEQPKLDRPAVEKVTAWRVGRVEFDKVPLVDAVAEMNRYSSMKLVVEQPSTAGLIINGTFRAGAAASFAQAVAAAYKLKIIEKKDQIVLAGQPDFASPSVALQAD